MLLLGKVGERVLEVSRLRAVYEREERSDRLCSRLEIALASGLLTEADVGLALAKAAAGDDLVPLTTTLEFLDGAPLSSLRPSVAEALLDRPVRLGADLPDGLALTCDTGEDRFVRTCREYQNAVENGFYCDTNFAIKVSSSFMVALEVLKALSACRPSIRSFIRHPRRGLCDIDLLPSSLLPSLGPSNNSYDSIVSRCLTIGDAVSMGSAQIKRVSSSSVAIELQGSGVYMREMLRADLDGDGCEDIFVSTYVYAVGGTLGFVAQPVVLARRDFNGRFNLTEMVPSPANRENADQSPES